MPIYLTKGKQTLPILMASILGLAACNGSSSGGGNDINDIGPRWFHGLLPGRRHAP